MVCQPLELPEKTQQNLVEMLQPSSFQFKVAAVNQPGNKARMLLDSLPLLEWVWVRD